MKQSKRIFAFLMAVALLATTLAFSANAKIVTPSNVTDAGVAYDQTSKIVLTTSLYASMILDEVDDMLKNAGIFLDIGALLPAGFPIKIGGKLDLRSIDAACQSLLEFQPTLETVFNLVPALSNKTSTNYPVANGGLNLNYLQRSTCRRSQGTNGSNDIYVLQSIFDLLADPTPGSSSYMTTRTRKNAQVLGGLVADLMTPGGIDKALGSLGSIVGSLLGDGGLDVDKMLRDLLIGLAYGKDTTPPTGADLTLDGIVQTLLSTLDLKIKINEGKENESVIDLGAILGKINIQSSSVYDLIDTILEPVYEDVLVPLLDGMLRDMLKDAVESEGFGDYVDVNFVPPAWDELGIDSTHTLVDQLNDIIGLFIGTVITYDFGAQAWTMGSNSNLVPNIIKVGKVLIKEFGNDIFPNAVFKPDSEIDAMGQMEFVAYLARTIVNQVMTYVYVPEEIGGAQINTLTKVLNVVLIEQAGDTIPEMYGTYVTNYYGANAASKLDLLATTLQLVSNYLVKLLYFKVDTNVLEERPASTTYNYDRSGLPTGRVTVGGTGANSLRFADSFDVTVGKLFNWVVGNYGGVINPSLINKNAKDNAWELASNVIFGLLNPSWLGVDYSTTGLKKMLIDDIIGQLLGSADVAAPGVAGQIKIDAALAIFAKQPTGGLNDKVTQFLINLLLDVLDLVLGGAAKGATSGNVSSGIRGQYTCLEDILTKTQYLGTLLTNLLTCFGVAGSRLIATAMPLLADVLNVKKMSGYRPPVFGLDRVTRYQPSVTFTIANDSGGLPVLNYKSNQAKMQEESYVYILQSATVTLVDANLGTPATPAGLTIVNNATGLAIGGTNPTVTLIPGQSATLKLNLPATAVNGLVTVAVRYAVQTGGKEITAPGVGLTTRVYTFVTDKFEWDDTLKEYVLNTDGNLKPKTDMGGTYQQMGGTPPPCGIDQGYANNITYPEYRFFNQHTTVGQFLDQLNVSVDRFNDMGVLVLDPDTGAEISYTPPEHEEDSFVMIDPLYYYYGYGDYSWGWEDMQLSEGVDSRLLDYFTIKEPGAATSIVKTENGSGGTMKPFTLKDSKAGEEILVNGEMVPILEAPITSLFTGPFKLQVGLLSDRTKNGMAGITHGDWADWGLSDFMANQTAQYFGVTLNFVIENDYDLAPLVNDIIDRDEQRGRYADGTTMDGYFNTFMADISRAAWIVFKPKDSSLISYTANLLYDDIERDLGRLVLKPGTATSTLEGMLQQIRGLKDNAYMDAGQKVNLDYWDPNYTYFAESDFIPTGFQKARDAISEAEKLIDRSNGIDPDKKGPPTAMEINYAESLLKRACDSRLLDSLTDWQLLPVAAYENAMEYQLAWMENPANFLPGTNVTFVQLKAAFDAVVLLDPYTYTDDYAIADSDIVLDGDSVRALMRAYDNIKAIQAAFVVVWDGDTWKDDRLGRAGGVYRSEFRSDLDPIEPYAMSTGGLAMLEALKRIPQSQLTRARDELVYAYKNILAGGDIDVRPIWTKLDIINKALAIDTIAAEGNKTLNALFTEYAAYFVPSYKATYLDLFGQMQTLLTTVKGNTAAEDTFMSTYPNFQAKIDDLAADLTKASKLMVAVVPNDGAYVYDSAADPSGIKVDLTVYETLAMTAQSEGKSVQEKYGSDVLKDTIADEFYDGYIYGLDITKPTLIAVPQGQATTPWAAPYRVINGSADAPVANNGKYLTGATVVVKDSLGAPIFKLKAVYFGDPNGNGVILENSELSDLGMVLAGIRWNVPGADKIVAGDYAPATMAMDVVTGGLLDDDDFTAFRTTGTRYVDQSLYAPDDSGTNLVIKGKPVAPPAN